MNTTLKINNSLLNKKTSLFLLLLCLFVICILSVFVGVKGFEFKKLYTGNIQSDLLLISRIPRTITLVLTGAGLSICGVILQQISQNKFISPTTAGTLDAAKLGILFGLFLFPGENMLLKLLFGVVFCFGLTAIFTFSIRRIVKRQTIMIPVLGVMYGYILNSIANIIGVELNIIQNMESWMVGNFAQSMQGQYEIIYLIFPLGIICYLYARKFTIVALGKAFSQNIGVNYTTIVNIGLLLTSIMVSTTILTVGTIPFIDLIIPNLVSLIYGDDAHKNLPFIACFGSIALVLCDIIGRVIIAPYEIPTSMIIGSVGALIFLFILIKKNR
ncbi:ABC transporter permease [Myroides injenensis]|uniref:ABC transporter permease n=1 Tax=Myroides injenensis TaxID=1183151 RepID=UPI00028A0BB5|nr:iron chelate uptake ABC transporter family permease subunit [Myroides injenensis]